MPITPDQMKLVRSAVSKYNLIQQSKGLPGLPQPAPLDAEISSPAPTSFSQFGQDLAGMGGLGATPIGVAREAIKFLPPRVQGFTKKLGASLVGAGPALEEQQPAFQALQPENLKEKIGYGLGAGVAGLGQLTALMGAGASAPLAGGIQGVVEQTPISIHKAKQEILTGEASPVEASLKGAGEVAYAGLKGAALMKFLGSVMHGAGKAFVNPETKAAFDGLAKQVGHGAADTLYDMSHRVVQGLAGGAANVATDAVITPLESTFSQERKDAGLPIQFATAEDLIASGVVGTGLGLVGGKIERRTAFEKLPDALKKAVDPSIKLLTYDPKAEVNTPLMESAKEARIAKVVDLAESVANIHVDEAGKKVIGTGNPDQVAAFHRAMEYKSKLLGDQAGVEFHQAEANKAEQNSSRWGELQALYAGLKSKAQKLVDLGVNMRNEIAAREMNLPGVKGRDTSAVYRADAVSKYVLQAAKLDALLIDMYGTSTPKFKESIYANLEANSQSTGSALEVEANMKRLQALTSKPILESEGKSTVPPTPKTGKPEDTGIPITDPLSSARFVRKKTRKGTIVIPVENQVAMADGDVVNEAVGKESIARGEPVRQAIAQVAANDAAPNLDGQQGPKIPALALRSVLDSNTINEIMTSARTLIRAPFGHGMEVFRSLAEMLPGGPTNPLYRLITDTALKTTVKAAVTGHTRIGELYNKLTSYGFDINVKRGTWNGKEMGRFVVYIENKSKGVDVANAELAKFGRAPLSQAEITKFENGDKVVRPLFDEYFDKLNAYRAKSGLPEVKKVTDYVTWLGTNEGLPLDGLFNNEGDAFSSKSAYTGPERVKLRYENKRGKVAPEKRLSLPEVLQKYVHDIEHATEQLPALHAAKIYEAAFAQLANEKRQYTAMAEQAAQKGQQVPPTNLALPAEDYLAASKLMKEITLTITGTRGRTNLENMIRATRLPKYINNWTSQIVSTPITWFNQILGAIPMTAETGLGNTSSGLAEQFWSSLGETVNNPSSLSAVLRESKVFQSRLHSNEHRLLVQDSTRLSNVLHQSIGLHIGKPIAYVSHLLDTFMVGAAFRAGYKQAMQTPGMTHENAVAFGDYVAAKTQGVYETALRPLILHEFLGRMVAPLSTSTFSQFNTLKDAMIKDYKDIAKGQPLTAHRFAVASAAAIALRMVLNGMTNRTGNPFADYVMDSIPILGTISRYGTIGALSGVTNIIKGVHTGRPENIAKAVLPFTSAPPGSLTAINFAMTMKALSQGGDIVDKNGQTMYSIDPNNIKDLATSLLLGPSKSEGGAKYIEDRYPDTIDKIVDWIKSTIDI